MPRHPNTTNPILPIKQRDVLIEAHIDDALRIAKGFSRKYKLDLVEFESLVLQKLIEVANRYDPDRGPFKPYLLNSLRGYCFNFMRDNSRAVKLPRVFTDILLRSYKYKRSIGNWDAPIPEVASAIGVEADKLEEVYDAMAIRYVEVKDSHIALEEDEVNMRELRQRLADLPEKAEKMLTMYYVDKKTFKEVAQEFKISVTKVKRIINNSVSYLKD